MDALAVVAAGVFIMYAPPARTCRRMGSISKTTRFVEGEESETGSRFELGVEAGMQ